MKVKIIVSDDKDDMVLQDNINDDSNFMQLRVNDKKKYIYMTFSSRAALYDFARSLLYESINGDSGQLEFYYLAMGDKNYLVNGVRFTKDNPRLFIEYPIEPLLDRKKLE